MPLIRMRALEADEICTISTKMIDELQELIKCPRDYFAIEVMHSTFIKDGEFVKGSPVVGVSFSINFT